MSSEFNMQVAMEAVGFDELQKDLDALRTTTEDYIHTNEEGAKKSESFGSALSRNKIGVVQLGAAFGTVISSGLKLFNTYESMIKAQNRLDKANIQVETKTKAVAKAQQEYNEAVAIFGPNSKAAHDAQVTLTIATDKLTEAMDLADQRIRDVTESQLRFAGELPTLTFGLIGAVAGFIDIAKNMKNVGALGPKVAKALTAVGTAMRFIGPPQLTIPLVALGAVFVAISTNAFGFRDALNAVGKAIGDALPILKSFLGGLQELFNRISALFPGTKEAESATTEYAVASEDATVSVDGLTEATKNAEGALVLAAGANKIVNEAFEEHGARIIDVVSNYKAMQDSTETNQKLYELWKETIRTGNNEVMGSYSLTEDQVKEFMDKLGDEQKESRKLTEEWAKAQQQATDEFDAAWQKSVASVVSSLESFNSGMTESVSSLGAKRAELFKELEELSMKELDLEGKNKKERRKARKEHEEDQQAIIDKIAETEEGLSSFAVANADTWHAFGESVQTGMDVFFQEVSAGQFKQAIDGLSTSLEDVPPTVQASMSEVTKVLNTEALTEREIINTIAFGFDDLIKKTQELRLGSQSLTPALAEQAAGLDELAVQARLGAESQLGMDVAARQLHSSMTEQQQNLDVVTDSWNMFQRGQITAEEFMTRVEAAGQQMSKTLGTEVTQSIKNLDRTVIDMGNGIEVVVADVGGQMVNLGTQTAAGTGEAIAGLQGVGTASQQELEERTVNALGTAAHETATQMSNMSTSVKTWTNSMKLNWFNYLSVTQKNLLIFDAKINDTGKAISSLSSNVKTWTTSMKGNISSFSSSAVSSLNKVTAAAKKTTSALNSMAAAARKAAAARSSVGGMMHGGSVISGFGNAQHGFSGIVNKPTTFRGINMGEDFRPELVTVQPLTRGTGNTFGGNARGGGGGAGGGMLNANFTIVLDGRELQRFTQRVALSGLNSQV